MQRDPIRRITIDTIKLIIDDIVRSVDDITRSIKLDKGDCEAFKAVVWRIVFNVLDSHIYSIVRAYSDTIYDVTRTMLLYRLGIGEAVARGMPSMTTVTEVGEVDKIVDDMTSNLDTVSRHLGESLSELMKVLIDKIRSINVKIEGVCKQ